MLLSVPDMKPTQPTIRTKTLILYGDEAQMSPGAGPGDIVRVISGLGDPTVTLGLALVVAVSPDGGVTVEFLP